MLARPSSRRASLGITGCGKLQLQVVGRVPERRMVQGLEGSQDCDRDVVAVLQPPQPLSALGYRTPAQALLESGKIGVQLSA